ncbi:uncharacterized protein LOC133780357 [Humulus lupulus]|uniref:uncharacterized protein LOC133780357 n=1 Tax=Humulus lupulus TaxID=3486 RepID=UPI002B40AE26|nr:uncharacterized protein LOC133780357 [Humulus lupulus]
MAGGGSRVWARRRRGWTEGWALLSLHEHKPISTQDLFHFQGKFLVKIASLSDALSLSYQDVVDVHDSLAAEAEHGDASRKERSSVQGVEQVYIEMHFFGVILDNIDS